MVFTFDFVEDQGGDLQFVTAVEAILPHIEQLPGLVRPTAYAAMRESADEILKVVERQRQRDINNN